MANHEKSKKHKENMAALKLILQEETGETQSTSDSDDKSAVKCDRLSDNSDKCSDKVDGHVNTRNDKWDNKELSINDTTQQLPSNPSNDRLADNSSVPSTDRGDSDSIMSDDDILLLLARNKTKQAEKLPGYHEDQVETVSMPTTNKQQEHVIQDERCNKCFNCSIVVLFIPD